MHKNKQEVYEKVLDFVRLESGKLKDSKDFHSNSYAPMKMKKNTRAAFDGYSPYAITPSQAECFLQVRGRKIQKWMSGTRRAVSKSQSLYCYSELVKYNCHGFCHYGTIHVYFKTRTSAR